YLRAHQAGGRHVSEATAALELIDRERDVHMYRQAYEFAIAHPNDIPGVSAALRSYLDANTTGRFTQAAKSYLAWWEKISLPGDYKVILRRGEVDSDVGKWLSGGAPNLGVVLWVGGVKYGPTPVVPNSHRPIWEY